VRVSGDEAARFGVDAPAGRGVQAGDGNRQVNEFSGDQSRQEVGAGRDAYVAGGNLTVHHYGDAHREPEPERPVVVGDVPQEPAAFQPRDGLMEALEHQPAGRVRVVFAVTGIRGGKTQVAAAYARRRIAEGWRLVAWVDASDEVSLLAGLAQVAAAAGEGAAGEGAAEVDAGLGDLADASLVGFTVDGGSVLAHRLVMRVARERLAAGGRLAAELDGAVGVLAGAAGGSARRGVTRPGA
jgi:hypothetical protein